MALETTIFQAADSQVMIAKHGGQVLSWRASDGVERLYTPKLLEHSSGFALRGGVPVCFPQFANRGPVMKHGFARLLPWTCEDQAERKIVFSLMDDAYTRSVWNHPFKLEQHISLTETTLTIELIIKNMGKDAFLFTNALHTYFRVQNALDIKVQGLRGVQYEDALQQSTMKTQQSDFLQVEDELDRVYQAPQNPLILFETDQKAIRIEQLGFTDTVVWNPGFVKACELKDMPASDWQNMLCIEAAVASKTLTINAGEQWRGSQHISLLN
jgi:glucose-6-phosphate 1-epimerase